MSPLAFIKVIMATVFMHSGEIVTTTWVDTTYDKCEEAQEEAVRFNHRPMNDDYEVYVQCFFDWSNTMEA